MEFNFSSKMKQRNTILRPNENSFFTLSGYIEVLLPRLFLENYINNIDTAYVQVLLRCYLSK